MSEPTVTGVKRLPFANWISSGLKPPSGRVRAKTYHKSQDTEVVQYLRVMNLGNSLDFNRKVAIASR